MQDTIKDLRSKEAESDQKAESPQIEMFDFKTKFAETKAFAKTIDMELRKLDVNQANTHVSLLQSFMPDSFLNRGGRIALEKIFFYQPIYIIGPVKLNL